MLKRVQAHISTMATQQVSTNGNFALVFALLVKLGINTSKRCPKSCDGLRGDAFVATQEIGLDNRCEIVDGRPRGIDTLIERMRGMGFPLTGHMSRDDDVAGHS